MLSGRSPNRTMSSSSTRVCVVTHMAKYRPACDTLFLRRYEHNSTSMYNRLAHMMELHIYFADAGVADDAWPFPLCKLQFLRIDQLVDCASVHSFRQCGRFQQVLQEPFFKSFYIVSTPHQSSFFCRMPLVVSLFTRCRDCPAVHEVFLQPNILLFLSSFTYTHLIHFGKFIEHPIEDESCVVLPLCMPGKSTIQQIVHSLSPSFEDLLYCSLARRDDIDA